MQTPSLSLREKAVQINSDPSIYGSFAEIGAGQETSRWFFRTKGASQTVAKAISAYDMTFSDAIYGREPSGRYVCESRVKKMVHHEFELIQERLKSERGDRTKFFSFANSVAARSQKTGDTGQGWLGLRWQGDFHADSNEIHLHIRLFDKRNTLQQEALGNVGVNLIYGAYFYQNDPERLIKCLKEDIEDRRIEVDYISFSGPLFKNFNNQIGNLYLLKNNLTKSITFSAEGEPKQPTDLLFKKNLLLFRDSYRPITNYHMDLLECAQHQFVKELEAPQNTSANVFTVAEIPFSKLQALSKHPGIEFESLAQPVETFESLSAGPKSNSQKIQQSDHYNFEKDFLERLALLFKMKIAVAITNFSEYFEFESFFEQNFVNQARILIKVDELTELLDEKSYRELRGGMLEGLGRYFQKGYRFYVSPSLKGQEIHDTSNFEVSSNTRFFLEHLLHNGWLKGTPCLNQAHLKIKGEQIIQQISKGQVEWKALVPEQVATMIEEKKFFNI